MNNKEIAGGIGMTLCDEQLLADQVAGNHRSTRLLTDDEIRLISGGPEGTVTTGAE